MTEAHPGRQAAGLRRQPRRERRAWPRPLPRQPAASQPASLGRWQLRRACCLGALATTLLLACRGGETSFVVEIDLAARFDLADTTFESGEVNLGGYDRRSELAHGWSEPREGEDGSRFANERGQQAGINWHLNWVRPLDLIFTGRSMAEAGEAPTRVRLTWNREPLGEIVLVPGRGLEDHRIEVPVAMQEPGRNVIRLNYPALEDSPTMPRVAWTRIRAEGQGVASAPGRTADGALRLPFGASLDYYFVAPDGGVVEFDDIALYGPQGAWRNADPPPGLAVSVHRFATAPAAGVHTFREASGRLELKPHDQPLRVRIEPEVGARLPSAEAGYTFRATLRTTGDPWPHAAEAGAHLPPPEPAAEHDGGKSEAPGASGDAEPPPHVLIFLVDTLRADRLGCYGYDRPTTPHIDRFAEGGAVFLHAVAQSAWTRPTTASILTGLYPHNHGARSRNHVLAEDVAYLPQVLREHGYLAVGISTNGNAGMEYGFERGFEHYTQLREDTKRPGVHVPASRAVDLALEQIDGLAPNESFFAYVHVTDPHAPYFPPERFRQQFAPDAPAEPLGRNLGKPSPEELPHLSNLYDGEVAFVDEQFGRLLKELDSRGHLERTLVVLVSDHGEEFNDHGSYGHGSTLYREQLHVPLIVRLPDRLRAQGDRSRVSSQVQQIDIVPTILEAIGKPDLIATDGQSLLPTIRSGERPDHHLALADLRLDGQGKDAVLLELPDRHHKLIDSRTSNSGSFRFLYDARADPAEQADILEREGHWAGYLRALGRLMQRGAAPLDAGAEPDLPPEQRKALEALGYLD